MANTLFKVFFEIIVSIANLFLAPINTLVVNFIPDVSTLLNTFVSGLSLLGNGFAYFGSILPPTCRTMIIIYLTFLISYYTLTFTLHAIIKVIDIIKAIKIW